MGNVRGHVHATANPMTAEVPDDTASMGAGQLDDCRADVSETRTRPDLCDAGVQATFGHIADLTRFRRNLADAEGPRRVSVESLEFAGHVDVDDVPAVETLVGRRNAVTHDLVSARAHRGREALVPELARRCAAPRRFDANEVIDVGGRHTRAQLLTDFGEHLRRNFTGASHGLDLRDTEQLDVHGPA